FYEAGYFAGRGAAQSKARPIYCIARPNVDAPGPLSDLQMVTDNERLIADLIDIYKSNRVAYDAVNLRQSITQASKGLFSKLGEFVSDPRVYFVADDADFGEQPELPASGVLKGDSALLKQLFAIGKDTIPWTDIAGTGARDRNRSPQELFFFTKWLEEMKTIILAARENRFIPAQTVLVRGSMRVRFLLYVARSQADGLYSCEFLVIEEVGGPAIGVPQQQLSLLTSVRLGFRFRYEFIKRFDADPADLSDEQRRAWTREIPQIIDRMVAESDTRGNITLEDLENAFDEDEEAARIRTIVRYWPMLKDNLYEALGLSPDGKSASNQGLIGPNVDKYRLAFEALQLINLEFLSRCCDRVSRKRKRPEEDLRRNADVIDRNVRALARMKAQPAVPSAPPAPSDRPDAGP